MTALFLKVLEMSVMGSVVILVTILTRFLLRKRSKRFIMILWAVVAVRLLIPLNIGSDISIFNYIPLNPGAISSQVPEASKAEEKAVAAEFEKTEEQASSDEFHSEALAVNTGSNAYTEAVQTEAASPVKTVQTKAMPDIRTVLAGIWLTGTLAIVSYMAVRYILLKIKLRGAVKTDRNVYESTKVKSPFVFGLIVPKIYLPEALDPAEREYILMHERTHIRRGDWLRKIAGMTVVAVHWFNPFVWLSYVLFGQDIEMCCDETTVAGMDKALLQAYAISIVNYAKRSKKNYLVTTLGFSSSDICKSEVTHRVKNIISYRKGTKFTTVVITAALLFMSASLALNSKPVIADEELKSSDAKIEAPAQRPAPFNYVTAVPEIVKTNGREKTVAFYRDGKAISGKLNLPEGDGPYKTIILLGVPNGPGYEKLTKSFTGSGYAVVMFDPNLADEDYTAPAPNNGLVFHTLLDLYAVMDELRYLPDVDLSNVYLWGHQSGGTVAAYAGTERQSEIKGMVLVEPEFDEYTFSEEPLLKVNIYDILPNCSVPATVVWGTLHPSTRPAQKAADLLQNGKLVVLDGNSYSRTFEDSFAERTAEVTINSFHS